MRMMDECDTHRINASVEGQNKGLHLALSQIHLFIENGNGLKMGQNATFSAPVQCSSPRRRARGVFNLDALPSPRRTRISSFDQCLLRLGEGCFTLANPRPLEFFVFSFASVKLSLRLGEPVLLGKLCFLALFALFFACFTFHSCKT